MSDEAPPSNPSAGAKPPSRRRTSIAQKSSMDAGKASLRGPSTDGPHPAPPSSDQHTAMTLDLSESTTKQSMDRRTLEELLSPTGPTTPNPFGTRQGTLDLDDYFVSSLYVDGTVVRECGANGE